MTPVADLHCDTAHLLRAGADLAAGIPDGHLDLPRMRASGVKLQVFAAYVKADTPLERALEEALSLLDAVDEAVAAAQGISEARTREEAESAWASGEVVAVKAVENGLALQSRSETLDLLRARGVRILTLTHTAHLDWASSSGPEDEPDWGLTPLGEELVRHMEALDILVDVSHTSRATVRHVARMATRPWIASHSCCAALNPHPRNLDDDQLLALAEAGGVVGICFHPSFLHKGFWEAEHREALDLYEEWLRIDKLEGAAWVRATGEVWRAYARRMAPFAVPLSRVAEHAAHAVKVAGEDAVALGSDFDGVPALPAGMEGCEALPRLLEVLSEHLPKRVVDKVAFTNARRVLLG